MVTQSSGALETWLVGPRARKVDFTEFNQNTLRSQMAPAAVLLHNIMKAIQTQDKRQPCPLLLRPSGLQGSDILSDNQQQNKPEHGDW